MPVQGGSISEFLSRVEESIRMCEYATAANLCREVQALPGASTLELARTKELLAFCHFREAFQSINREGLEAAMLLSHDCYPEISALYRKAGSNGLLMRSYARELFTDFWLCRESDERRKIADRCIELSGEAIRCLEEEQNRPALAEARTDFLAYCREALELATERMTSDQLFENCLKIARDAISDSRTLGNDQSLLHSLHVELWLLGFMAQILLPPDRFQALASETRQHEKDFLEVSRRLGTSYARCLAIEASGDVAFDLDGDYARAFDLYEEAARFAQTSKDSLVVGRTLSAAAHVSEGLALGEEYVENRRLILERGVSFASHAIEALQVPFHTTYLSAAHHAYTVCRISLATSVETEKEKKRVQLRQAVDIARKGTTYETGTWAWRLVAHGLSKALYFLAIMEESPQEKTRLLQEALRTREETVAAANLFQPDSWSQGVFLNYLALIKVELAEREEDPQVKTGLFRSAVSDMKRCLELCLRSAPNPSYHRPLAQYYESYGDALIKFRTITSQEETAGEAVSAYQESIVHLTKSGTVGPVILLRWKIARVYDSLGEYRAASRAFREASEGYRTLAESIQGLGTTYGELGDYMQAWTEIEEARLAHKDEDYAKAGKCYARAARTLEATRSWAYLPKLLFARSLIEKGEVQSRNEEHQSSIKTFRSALSALHEGRREVKNRQNASGDAREQQELKDWLETVGQREAYANGRIDLEEAKLLDMRGEKISSSTKYQSAFATFKTLSARSPAGQDRKEMETLAQFCASWARMKEAESKVSPELFAEASESFLKAKESATNQGPRLLALANASICRALESGTRFRQSRDVRFYSDIKRDLEVAADYYTEAGFRKTGTWTRATQRLFDALMLLADAEARPDVEKKTALYQMAEKHLVLAAKLYGEAGFPSRKRETLQQMERAREEREVLLAPLEVLAEVPTASAAGLPSVSLRGAKPSGLEKFEEANIAGEIRVPHRHLPIGSELTIWLDMVNIGKTVATLVKLEDFVPEGFERIEQGDPQQNHGNSLDLRGKMLDYLKTHEVKVALRAAGIGNFDLAPRVVYVDQKGNFRSYEFRPTVLSVREQVISEGVQAPVSVALPSEFRFEDERSKEVFRHLVKGFADDYMSRRLVMEKAGWRSMMDVIRETKIPRSALYGPEGRNGSVLVELERRGLVETRIFPKERGRGGMIRRIRIAYDNVVVKRIVEQAVMGTQD